MKMRKILQLYLCEILLCVIGLGMLIVFVEAEEVTSPNEINFERKASKLVGEIDKPPGDTREYRGLILPNEMKVILISDPSATEAAASICVAAGSMNNPEDLPGLAHFAEHMLFLGSEKYPEENSFQKFLSEHGGNSNAATHTDETYYYFKVAAPFLKEAIDRFAHLFIRPLFREEALEREVMAVHSEHQKNIPDDRRRLERILSLTTKPGHPYGFFRTGNVETLWRGPRDQGVDIRQALLDFHDKYYSSNLMSLALLGNDTLDELQELVEDIFIELPNKNTTLPIWEDNPYGPDELQEEIQILPIGSARSLVLIFPIQYIAEYYRTTGGGYVAHVLGQEGSGSFASLLKQKHWANYVAAGPDNSARGFTTFNIKIKLTEEGLKNIENVILHLFQAIEMMRESGPQKWFWEEVRDLNNIHFRFSDESYPLDLVKRFSYQMTRYPIELVYHAGGVPPNAQYDAQDIEDTLKLLTPQNCRIIILSKHFRNSTKFVEKYYGIKYNREKINPLWLKNWSECGKNEELHLPLLNEFIPSEFQLKERDEESINLSPRIIKNSDLSQVWYLQDTEFLLPKASVKVEIFSPEAYMDPLRTNLNYLFSSVLLESLSEFQYNGNLAGLESDIANTYYGLLVRVRGYDHKLGSFLHKIFEKIVSFGEVDPQRFVTFADLRRRVLRNRLDQQPYEEVSDILKVLLWQQRWSTQQLIQLMDDVTVESLQLFVHQFLSRLKFRWHFYGNLTPNESLAISEDVENLFLEIRGTKALFSSQIPSYRVVQLPPGSSYIYKASHTSHSSSCASVLFQLGLDDERQNVLADLLEAVAFHPTFDQLRTKEQLGYTVWAHAYADKARGPFYFRFIVQGDHHPSYVESRIDSFINHLEDIFGNMTDIDFTRVVASVRAKKLNKPKTMEQRAERIFSEIQAESYNFHRMKVEADELDLLTLQDLKDFFHEKLVSNATRSRLVIHVVSMEETGAAERSSKFQNYNPFNLTHSEEILEPSHWKKKLGLLPSIKQFNTSFPSL